MKQNHFFLNVLFTATFSLALLVCVILRTFFPLVILPQWSIPNLVLISLPALLAEHYAAGAGKRNYPAIFLLAAASCALLPWSAGFITPLEMVRCALSGGLVFSAVTWLFTSMSDRLSTGPSAKFAPILGSLGLYLAAQCFQGILL